MFGVHIQEYHSIYLTVAVVLVILFLSFQWWRKDKRIKSVTKVILIAAVGFIFYKLVFFTTTMVLFLGSTAKDHFFANVTEAQIIDFKIQKSRPSKGTLAYPIVQYQDHNGLQQKMRVDTGFGSSDAPKLHETVKIVVDEKAHQARLVTDLKVMTGIGALIFIFFGLIILSGITEYALTSKLEKVQSSVVFGSFYVLIPLLITGAAYFFGKSAWDHFIKDHFSRRFWIHSCITVGCLLFMVGYINILWKK
ncbi:DUF3592 domain-containing protein [Chryseobacterium sp. JM1]|uniref:DUF3592 domain-containing protein n=1 Tax=Chryseobacterium sp. JM1 TaxID=1233950 RepID=UPI0004E7134C|nr:DUF3592 domain-containing protein [Chryseobacterium sp. JM1]KFF21419.1 hypothetical protein IW22_05445 [Chryseobacterium sp. JM1]